MTFKALNGLGPMYLWDRLFPYSHQRTLRSAGQCLLRVPGHKEIKVALTWWNSLPSEIRALKELNQFLRACKIELFRQAYG